MADLLHLSIYLALSWVIFCLPFKSFHIFFTPTLQVDSLPAEPQGKSKNIGVDSLALLQWIFLTQNWTWLRIELGSPALQADSSTAELWGKPIKSTYLSLALVVRGWMIGKEQVSGSSAVRKGKTGTQHRTGYSWPKSKGNNCRNATLTITRFEVVWWDILLLILYLLIYFCSVLCDQ